MRVDARRLDLVAFAAIGLIVTLVWLPTLRSGRRVNHNEDFYLHAARHEAVRRSILQYHTLPLRSHWFGGGYPIIGEPEDPTLNPLVLLSVAFGSVMGPKLISIVAVLAAAAATYALGRYVLEYTRWGALFSGLVVGTSLYAPERMESGSPTDLCPMYLPVCLLLIGLAWRGRRAALFVLPFVLYIMMSDGKQAFVLATCYMGMLCLMDALPWLRVFGPAEAPARFQIRALRILVVALAATFLLGMIRILPVLDFIKSQGGLSHIGPSYHVESLGVYGGTWRWFLELVLGLVGWFDMTTVGLLPAIILVVAAVCFRRRVLPWVVLTVLAGWLALAEVAPLNLFALLQRLPVFSMIYKPYKYFAFELVFSIVMGSGAFFWLLSRLRRRWLEHVCAAVLIAGAAGFLAHRSSFFVQPRTYTAEIPSWAHVQEQFYNVQGLHLPRQRKEPLEAVAYFNVLRNVGTIDYYTAVPLPENATPKFFVDAAGAELPNPAYRGEAFFVAGSQGNVGRIAFSPNAIAVEVTVHEPGVLVINQNHHPAWRTDTGELLDRGGLLAVSLRETGSYTVHLRYRPWSFTVGLAVSLVSLVGWVAAFRLAHRRTAGEAEPEGSAGGLTGLH